jgi:Ser/Thr protein kinase RdoA (MazF antagonist)
VGIEEEMPVIAKFYRPGRWTDEQIQEEHDFSLELAEAEIPLIAPDVIFCSFDTRELQLIEALRTLRMLHHAAWLARRWEDPAFPVAFPWFDSPRYWEDLVLSLREQFAAMQEPALELPY